MCVGLGRILEEWEVGWKDRGGVVWRVREEEEGLARLTRDGDIKSCILVFDHFLCEIQYITFL